MSPTNLLLNSADFDPAAISPVSHAFNSNLALSGSKEPKWQDIGPAKYRRLRTEGKTTLPRPPLLPSATSFTVPARDHGRTIPCRILKPQGQSVKAVLMHIHGGGWVLSDETYEDQMLQDIANDHGLLCISVGYRLAPENPFPAGPHDCFDVVEWLIDNAETALNAPLSFVGGDSAGAHLSMLVALHLMQHPDAKFSEFRLRGLLLHYGCYSLTWTPRVYSFARRVPSLVLDLKTMEAFRDAFIPGWSQETLQNPAISPLYADFEGLRGKLPPVLFTCGTKDYLLDDTLFMSMKWLVAGGEVHLKIIPGAPHGFISFPRDTVGAGTAEGIEAVDEFLRKQLA